jgi:DNA-binding MarR family transcriptional regulator
MTEYSSEKAKSCSECVCFNLRKATRVATQIYDNVLRPAGIRGTQFSIMAVLAIVGSETITNLSEILVMDRTTLSRNLKPMEKASLIKISQGKDQRTKSVSLTRKGVKTFEEAYPLWKKAQTRIVEHLGRERFNSFLEDLNKISSVYPEVYG